MAAKSNPEQSPEQNSEPTPEQSPAQKSQAQMVLENAGQEAKTPEEATEEGTAGASGEDAAIQYFPSTIAKVTADGREVLSDHLMPGERLRRHGDEAKETAAEETSADK